MAKWKYTIKNGKALREAIEDGDSAATIECLMNCFNELWSLLDEEDLEDYDIDLENIVDTLSFWSAYHSSDEDDTEIIDDYLAEFYDICDNVRAWITL